MFGLEVALITAKCLMAVEVNKLKMLRSLLKVAKRISCITAVYRKKLVAKGDFFSVLNNVGSDAQY